MYFPLSFPGLAQNAWFIKYAITKVKTNGDLTYGPWALKELIQNEGELSSPLSLRLLAPLVARLPKVGQLDAYMKPGMKTSSYLV